MTLGKPRYKRILLKLSGEALMGDQGFGISPEMLAYVAAEVQSIYDLGMEIAIVVGGGNIFRGVAASSFGMERTSADHMGMLATIMNSLALQDALEKNDIQTRVQTAISMHEVAEPYIRRRAARHLERGRVVIFAAGTGNPYFTTDTAAVLRAQEIHAEILFKATKVNGLYDADPEREPDADGRVPPGLRGSLSRVYGCNGCRATPGILGPVAGVSRRICCIRERSRTCERTGCALSSTRPVRVFQERRSPKTSFSMAS